MNDEKKQLMMAQTVHELKINLIAIFEHEELLAKIKRHRFAALVREGFTEQQALELCK